VDVYTYATDAPSVGIAGADASNYGTGDSGDPSAVDP